MTKSAKYLTTTAEGRKWEDDLDAQRKEIVDAQNKPKYLLTVYQTGDLSMTMGDSERQECPRRYFVPNASLLDIQETIQKMNVPYWSHPKIDFDSTEEEKDAIPFEEKRWSIVYDFDIEPMTKELEDRYVEGVKNGFFRKYRKLYGTSKS